MKMLNEATVGEGPLPQREADVADADLSLKIIRRGVIASSYLDIPDQDDRYPGSFFRIPGPPIPGKTTWSIN